MKFTICIVSLIVLTNVVFARSTDKNFIKEEYRKEQGEIKKRVLEIYKAAKKRDLKKLHLAHLYGPKFSKFSDLAPYGIRDSKQSKKDEDKYFRNVTKFEYKIEGLRVDVFGDVAVAAFLLHFQDEYEGQKAQGTDRVTFVMVKEGNDWKIAHEHLSTIPMGEENKL